MTASETQANPDTILGIMTVFVHLHEFFFILDRVSHLSVHHCIAYRLRVITVKTQIGSYNPSRRTDNSYFYIQML